MDVCEDIWLVPEGCSDLFRYADLRRRRLSAILLNLTLLLAFTKSVTAQTPIAFVQGNFAAPPGTTSSVNVPYSDPQTAGDLNVVVVGWNDTNAQVQSVTDTRGNVYVRAVGPTTRTSLGSQSIYYAANIASAATGGNSVRVVFSSTAQYPDIRIAEYSGVATSNPLDGAVGAQGNNSTTSNSGTVTTTNANDLLVGANLVAQQTIAAGSGYTARIITSPDGDILEDRIVSSIGSYNATAILTGGSWIMQLAAFRAAPASDTQAPSAPTGLTATAGSTTQINLAWTESTDNVGVTSYLIERCQGEGCAAFAQIATATGPAYVDGTVSASTSYSYRVRAVDAASNLGGYSNTASVTTPAPAGSIGLVQATRADAGVTTTSSLAFTASNTAGNWIAVAIRAGQAGQTFVVSDTRGNTYRRAAQLNETTDGTTVALFYAENISAGTNTVTVSDSLAGGTLRFAILEYAGVASADSLDVTAAAQGTSATPSSGTVTTTTGGELILGVVSSANGVTFGAGTGYAIETQVPDAPNAKFMVEDRRQTVAGPVSATATLSASDDWGALVATVRPAGPALDTQAPTTPSNLTATLASSTQVNLTWTVSTDNVGVTNYLIERCQGGGCTTFVQLGTTATPAYSDGTVSAASSYSYRVRAGDAAANLSSYSNIASVTTPAASDTQAPTAPSGLAATVVSTTLVNLVWTASADNVGVTSYLVERCEGAGCSTFTQIGTAVTPAYSDGTVSAASSYSYRVRASDAAANLSSYSNTASAATPAPPAAIALVQAAGLDAGVTTTASLSFTTGNTAGNWIAVAIRAGQAGQTLVVSDTRGNTYRRAVQFNETTDGTTVALFYAENIRGGPNTVTVSDSLTGATLRFVILEYTGIASTNSLDVTAAAQGTSATPSSGPVITTTSGELILGVVSSANVQTIGPGSGFAIEAQVPNAPNSKLAVEDQRQVVGGTVAAAATLSAPDDWGAVAAAFRAASPPPDTQAPTAPVGLTATAISSTDVNLAWTASTDEVGVTNYLIERCQGVSCSTFAQIGTTGNLAYSDGTVSASTSYSYRIRATDAASNLSGYSNTASATTPAGLDTQPPSAPGTVTATVVSGTRVDLSWVAATDNVGVTGYRVERCQGVGCSVFVKLATPTSTTFSDTGLTPNTSYSYVVLATDAAGNLGPYSNPVSVTTASNIPELVAAYSLNDGTGSAAVDISGRGNNGSIGSAAWTTAGKYGGALSFDGSSAKVVVPDSPSLRLTTALTLEAWVNPAVVDARWRDVVYKGDDNYFLEATTDQGGRPGAGLTLVPAVHNNTYGPNLLPVNTWTHLAQTYDGAAVRLYVNGVQVATTAQTGTVVISSYPLEIGGDGIYGQHFEGLIDEVRVFNVARTPTQIQSDMVTPLGGDTVVVSLSSSEIDFGQQAVGVSTGVRDVVLSNVEGPPVSIGSITISGVNASDFSQTNNCGNTLTAGSSCTIGVTFTPGAAGVRTASVTIDDDAPDSPQTVALQGTGVTVLVTPVVATLTPGRTQQFSAISNGTTSFLWSVDGAAGGSAGSGTITETGLYSSPATTGTHTVTATTSDGLHVGSASVYVVNYTGTLTLRNDNARTGANLDETVLTPSNVNPTRFGKLQSFDIDGEAYASPLYVPAVTIPEAGVHNVVFVATEHDSVYAFDADGLAQTPIWKVSFINPATGVTTVTPADVGECCDINPEIGISGTPVIDAQRGILYVVAKTKEVVGQTTNFVQRLHALDLATGAERLGGPVVIQASVPGQGVGSAGGQVTFSPLRENQRPALLLHNGVVYIAFGSHGDQQPYHGWVLGYDAATLQQTVAYNATPNGEGAGVWIAGSGPAADSDGNIYFVTGDGTFDANGGGTSFGDSYLKMNPVGTILDYFTPHDQGVLDSNNIDLGSGGIVLLPDQPGVHPHLMVSAGKNGTIDLIDRDNMGHYRPNNDNQIVQTLINIFPFGTPEPGNYSAPVYFNGILYFSPVADNVQAFTLTNGLLSTSPTSRSSEIFAYPGGTLALSASGTANGILWAIERRESAAGALRAYDAANLGIELYNSDQAGSRDTLDTATKFSAPLIANGKVYVASKTKLTVFGLFQ